MLPTLAPLERERILRLALASKFEKKQTRAAQLTPTERGRPLPLSFAQLRLWFLEQVEPGKANYNVPIVLRLTGDVETRLLARALANVVERHEALRTRFVLSEDEETPFQQIDPPDDLPLQQVELTDTEAGADAAVQCWLGEQAKQPFDLARGPLLRASLLRMGPGRVWLCLVMHHAVVDGWSVDLLLRELAELYTAQHAGRPPVLPLLPIQYADFAHWQRHWMAGDVYEQQRRYWTDQLQGLQPLQLPGDFPRPPVQRFRGATERFHVPPALTHKLQALSQSEGATLFMTLLAAFQVLLARYSGQDDIAVGTPVANRNRAEIEDLIGFFINTLVLRTQVSPSLSFRQLLRQVRTTCLGAYAHQDMPFEKLVQELHPERDLSRSPLFQVMFVLQGAVGTDWRSVWEAGGLEASLDFGQTGNTKFDLHMTMAEEGDIIDGTLDYNTDLFTTERIQRLLGHYLALMERMAGSPDQAASEFSLLTQAEEQQLRVWNQTETTHRTRETLVSLFEQQVKRTPRTLALISGGHRLNYLNLNLRANQLAHYLVQLGVKRETLVGIQIERSIDAVIAILAVLKAGGAYLPLDPEYPRDRLQHMVAEASLGYIVTRSEGGAAPLSQQIKHVYLDTDWGQISRCSQGNLNTTISPDRGAYAIFTSGSTGRPKGLIGTHRATVNRLSWMHEKYPYAADEVCCARASMNFVDSVSELFGPLLKGITTVLLSPKLVLDLPQLTRVLAAHSVTRLLVVPSLLQIMLESHDSGQITLPRLKYWVTSGEAITSSIVNQLFACDPTTLLVNLYGSSEVAGDVTFHEISGPTGHPLVPIGRPISNTQVYLLDHHLQPVPVGVDGEIFVGGANLARGYLHHAASTAERFGPNPFGSQMGSRMYRTGDYGRYLINGDILVHGRMDFQVKVRGHRVELSEIESVLLAHPDVRQAVVVPCVHGDGHTNLYAYFVAGRESASLTSELRALLKCSLPSYMLPASLTELEVVPMTWNMKVNRQALSEMAASQIVSSVEEEPRSELEKAIRDIWKDLLDLDRLGLDDGFFDLGGHSLQLVRLRNRLRRATRQDVSILDLFTHTTIRGLVGLLSEKDPELLLQPGGTIGQVNEERTPVLVAL